jgi:hypothetical protein
VVMPIFAHVSRCIEMSLSGYKQFDNFDLMTSGAGSMQLVYAAGVSAM